MTPCNEVVYVLYTQAWFKPLGSNKAEGTSLIISTYGRCGCCQTALGMNDCFDLYYDTDAAGNLINA